MTHGTHETMPFLSVRCRCDSGFPEIPRNGCAIARSLSRQCCGSVVPIDVLAAVLILNMGVHDVYDVYDVFQDFGTWLQTIS